MEINGTFTAPRRPGKVVFPESGMGHPPTFERHLEAFGRKHRLEGKAVLTETFGPGITRQVAIMLIA